MIVLCVRRQQTGFDEMICLVTITLKLTLFGKSHDMMLLFYEELFDVVKKDSRGKFMTYGHWDATDSASHPVSIRHPAYFDDNDVLEIRIDPRTGEMDKFAVTIYHNYVQISKGKNLMMTKKGFKYVEIIVEATAEIVESRCTW